MKRELYILLVVLQEKWQRLRVPNPAKVSCHPAFEVARHVCNLPLRVLIIECSKLLY